MPGEPDSPEKYNIVCLNTNGLVLLYSGEVGEADEALQILSNVCLVVLYSYEIGCKMESFSA